MSEVRSTIWKAAPELGIPESPALLVDSRNLWLAYFQPLNESIAIVRFSGLIDHRLAPIGDEGLGRHPYVSAGLQPYSFNELIGSAEALRWKSAKPRHWVVTFKDETLDVIARAGEVIAADLTMASPLEALLSVHGLPGIDRLPGD
ncbi:hypothetical protein HX882_20890 [Pseudomonas gingeri]|uniref:Uncharacterized protein n=1 Tax=Pseudomonas gingeri TaxID=117681 RepID=A0A7Y8C433_9PSED|nr:hypothetical protein [Pseudomonas gingeri]NWB98359.1 hypothetical protein [Pseudomonas gingeri]